MFEKSPKSDLCPRCQTSWKKIKQEMKVGCEYCFLWFSEELSHFRGGVGVYQGPPPPWISNMKDRQEEEEKIHQKIQKAIEEERFEDITELEAKLREISEEEK